MSDRFEMLGFTVKTGAKPYFEIVLLSDLSALKDKSRRAESRFWASGALPAERGEAVFLVPPDVLRRFAGQPRLYYGLATFADANRTSPEVIKVPSEGSPWVSLGSYTGRPHRRSLMTRPRNGKGNGYPATKTEELTWAGDIAQPGTEPIGAPVATAPANGNGKGHANGNGKTNGSAKVATETAPASTASIAYDDGFGAMPLTTPEEEEADADKGIDFPVPDGTPETVAAAARGFSTQAPEYPQASRFAPAAANNFRARSAPRTINRIVIHITDGTSTTGTVGWFQNPKQQIRLRDGSMRSVTVSAHYVIGQDGEVVQMVRHNDIAWHASSANGDSIGIEHVARVRNPRLDPSEAQYCASAALVSWLCDQFGITKDRDHILGHAEADPKTTHTECPNAVWNWDHYMQLVLENVCEPQPAAQGFASARAYSAPGARRATPARAAARPLADESFASFWNDVELVPQQTDMSCWAAAAAMVVGWRDRISIDPAEIASGTGVWGAYKNGLYPKDHATLADAWGLTKESPQSYSVEGFRSLLEQNGPLWIGVAVPSGHAVVVTGLSGDGTADGTTVRYHDPWPPGAGAGDQEKTFASFIREYENRVTTNGDTVNVQIIHAGGTGGRSVASTAQAFAGALAFSSFDQQAVDQMRQEFVANVAAGSPKSCIIITNAGLRRLYGAGLLNADGTQKKLALTIQDTMAALTGYGLADAPQVFEFNDANNRPTRGVTRPDALRSSVKDWLLAEADKNQASAWYVFGLSLYSGYHSVVLALQFSGIGSPDTKIYWADQIYSGWDDVTAILDQRITQLTQGWWDKTFAKLGYGYRTATTVWPLLPAAPVVTQALSRASTLARRRRPGGRAFTVEGDDGIEGMEEESVVIATPMKAGECTDDFCPTNKASDASSDHFTVEEFRCRDGTAVPERFRGNVQEVMDNLEVLRAELGQPITINSGYRTCSYNSTLEGAASKSRHLCGQAADIRVAEHTPLEVRDAIERLIGAGRMKAGGLGLYNTFVHYDVRGTNQRWDRRTAKSSGVARGLGEIEADYSGVNSLAGAAKVFFEWLSRRMAFTIGVPSTAFFPHSAICKIRATDDGGNVIGEGSGFYVGPNKVLTAAHVVNGAAGVEVIPGLNGPDSPHGGASVAGPFRFPAGYRGEKDDTTDRDVAVIDSAPDAPKGQYFEMEELRMSPQSGVIVCGYAAEGPGVDPERQHLDVDTIHELKNGTFTYGAETRAGTSGGAVFYTPDGSTLRVVGIHVSAHDSKTNKGVRLTDALIAKI